MFQISTSQAYGPSYLPMYSIHLSYCDRKTMVTIAGWDQTPFQFLSFLKSPPQSLIGFTLSRKLLFYTTNRGQMTKEYYSGDPQSTKTWKSMWIFKEQPKQTYTCSQKYSKPIYYSIQIRNSIHKWAQSLFFPCSQTLNSPSFWCFLFV